MSGLGQRIHQRLSQVPPLDRVRQRVSDADRTNLYALAALLPTMFYLFLVAGFPIAYAVYISLTDSTLFAIAAPSFVGLENYMALLGEPEFLAAIKNGVIFTVGSVVFQIVIGVSLALLLNKKFRGSSIARSLVILTYLIPTVAAVLIWKWMLSQNRYGLVNSLLVRWDIVQTPVAFFANDTFAMASLIVVNGWKFTSFAVIIFLARLQSVDQSLYEQAKISGASTWQQFRDVTFPQLRSAILLVILLRGIWQFNKFDIVYLLTRGGPRGATRTVPVYIYETAFFSYDLALASAAAITLFILLGITASIYFWRLKPSQQVED